MTYQILSDQLFDSLHDFALAPTLLQRRMCAIAVLVAAFRLSQRFPKTSARVVGLNRLTVLPYVTRNGLILYLAAARRQGPPVTDDLMDHLLNLIQRAAETRLREVA